MRAALLLLVLVCPALPQTQESSLVKRARAVLEEGAANSDPDVRRDVAAALGLAARHDPSTKLLEKLAGDKDYLVRETALVSIGELRDPSLKKAARDALEDGVPEVSLAAARALFKMNDPEGKQLLIEIVEGEASAKSNFISSKVRDLMRKIKRPKSALLLVAQQGVGFIPVPGLGEGFSALNSLVNDPDFSARATVLLVLSSDKSPEVRKQIELAFNDSDWSMRAAATQIAASRYERTWRFRLAPLLEDSNRRVRYRAAACFLRLSQPGAEAAKK